MRIKDIMGEKMQALSRYLVYAVKVQHSFIKLAG